MKFSSPLTLLEELQSKWVAQLEDLYLFKAQVKARLLESQREWEVAVAERAAKTDPEAKQSYKKSDVAHLNRECLAFNRQYIALTRDIEKLENKVTEAEEEIYRGISASQKFQRKLLADLDAAISKHPSKPESTPLPTADANPEAKTATGGSPEPRPAVKQTQHDGDMADVDRAMKLLYPNDTMEQALTKLKAETQNSNGALTRREPVLA